MRLLPFHPAFSVVLLTLGACAAGGESTPPRPGVEGRVLHRSDIMNEPDTPYALGSVLVVPRNAASEPPREAVDEEALRLLSAVLTELDAMGEFTLDLAPGRYWVCVANLGEPRQPPPAYVFGCATVTVGTETRPNLTFYFGEGGLEHEIEPPTAKL